MDDILFSEGTQVEIDDLFGFVTEEVVEEVAPPEPEPVVEEKSTDIDIQAFVTEDFIDLLIDHARKGDVELVELKEEHGPEIIPEAPEAPKRRTIMEDYSDTLGALSKNLKTEELVTEDDRLTSLETQLIQVRQLFREATMVSGIGQGGDGQTPGSGVVKAVDLDDVNLDGIQPGDQLVWDGGQFVPANPIDPGDDVFATVDYVDEQDALRVLKAGDTMNGNLEFKSLTAENYLHINSLRPDGWTSSDSLFGLEINLADGNTYKNQLRVRGRSDKEIVRMWIQDEQRIETNAVLNLKPPANLAGNTTFFQCRDTNNDISLSVGVNGAVRAGTADAPFIPTEDHHLVTKKFSDERLQDVQNQIDNLEASNLTTTQLNYTYESGALSSGEFHTSPSATFANVTSFDFTERDKQNRVFPTDLTPGDVISTREATGTSFVQTFKIIDASDISNITVQPIATTAGNYTTTDSFIITLSRSFEGLATVDYVNTKVAITGDTMTGPLILDGDPGTGLQAATKNYVDNTVANATPNLDGVILADGSVPMVGTFESKNISVGNNASLMFASGNQYIKINNERTLGLYGYRTDSFTSAYTRNIEIKHSLTTFNTTTKASSNLISTRSSGYAFEVKPGDTDTNGYWHSAGNMLLKPQGLTGNAFEIYPKGLSSTNADVAFNVTWDGHVRLGSSVTIDNNLDVVTKGYVDTNFASSSDLSGYLPLSGGQLNGLLTISQSQNQAFRIVQNGVVRAQIWADGTYTTGKTSFNDSDLVTKKYVDDTIDSGALPARAIAGKRFGWRNNSTPLTGQLSYFAIGDTTSGVAMRVHFDSRDGRWAIAKDATFSGLNALFGIYYLNNGVLTPVRTGIVYEMTWQTAQSYVYCKIKQHVTNGSFNDSTDYYLTIGGLI